MTGVRIVGTTHRGLVRSINEDTFGVSGQLAARSGPDGALTVVENAPVPCLAVVADGLGGHPSGEVASTIAVDYLVGATPDELREIETAIRGANRSIYEAMESEDETVGMGTTVAAVVVHDMSVVIANVGDSPIYEWSDMRLTELSRDDSTSVGAKLPGLPSGGLSASLGGSPRFAEVDPHVLELSREHPRRLLICSDGLSNFVPRTEMTRALGVSDSEAAIGELLRSALHAGAPDNVTCVVLDVPASTLRSPKSQPA